MATDREALTRYTQWCQFTHKHGLNTSPVGELVLWVEHHRIVEELRAALAAETARADREAARANSNEGTTVEPPEIQVGDVVMDDLGAAVIYNADEAEFWNGHHDVLMAIYRTPHWRRGGAPL